MYIFEIGIVLNGLSILFENYEHKEQTNELIENSDLRNALLNAIIKMGESLMSEQIQEFKFKKYNLFILSKTIITHSTPEKISKFNESSDLIVYAIGDKELKVEFVQNILHKIYDKFIEMFPEIYSTQPADISEFKKFSPVFDNMLKDLKKSIDERFKEFL